MFAACVLSELIALNGVWRSCSCKGSLVVGAVVFKG